MARGRGTGSGTGSESGGDGEPAKGAKAKKPNHLNKALTALGSMVEAVDAKSGLVATQKKAILDTLDGIRVALRGIETAFADSDNLPSDGVYVALQAAATGKKLDLF